MTRSWPTSSAYTSDMRLRVLGSRPLATPTTKRSGPRPSVTIRASVLAPPEWAPITAMSMPSTASPNPSGPTTFSESGRCSGRTGCRRCSTSAGRMFWSNSLAHRNVRFPFRARCMAMAVPIAPAPNTVTLTTAGRILAPDRALDRYGAVADGEGHGLQLRMDPELPEQVPDVRLHRLRTDEEPARDVVVAQALGQQRQDLPFPIGELGEQELGVPSPLPLPGHLRQQAGQGHRLHQQPLVFVGGHDHDLGLRGDLFDVPGGVDAAHGPAELDVHEHDVRMALSDQIHCSFGRVDGRQQPHAGVVFDHAGERVGEQTVIITDHQLDLLLGEFVHGSSPRASPEGGLPPPA